MKITSMIVVCGAAIFVSGCAISSLFEPPPQPLDTRVGSSHRGSVAAPDGSSGGLEFLADIPSLKGVSPQMSEADFLDFMHQQKLDYQRGVEAGQTTYDVPVKDGGIVIFMFQDGHCSGIQRMSSAGGG